jgi:hypothetical protein
VREGEHRVGDVQIAAVVDVAGVQARRGAPLEKVQEDEDRIG